MQVLWKYCRCKKRKKKEKKKEEAYETFHMCTTAVLACHVYKDKTVHDTSHTHQVFTVCESVIVTT